MIRTKNIPTVFQAACLFLFIGSGATSSSEQGASEREVKDRLKAAYIFNFIQFVEWPSRAFEVETDPIIVGIFPGNSVARSLKEIAEGESIGGHPIIVRDLFEPEQARACHVVVIPPAEEARIMRILSSLKGTPALTVGESTGFAERGGAINLFFAENKLRFAVNPSVFETNELKVSSRLLRLGIIVETTSKE